MFKLPFDGPMPIEDYDTQVASHARYAFLDSPSDDDAYSSSSNSNICEYDPLDMSDLVKMQIDDEVVPPASNPNICEYDPLDMSSPDKTRIADDDF